ncbi:uncharacterized protein [Antedon mediterranea]|uniref:uncharacterized protein n=1 Tax=Antedon mediterranea TaxID=105859 RepID=UPI003AF49317
MSSQQDVQDRCLDHQDNSLESFCVTCTKSACKKCEHFVSCYANHVTRPMIDAVDDFNKQVNDVLVSAEDIKQELEATYDSMINDKGEFESHVKYIKKIIESHTEAIIETVREESNKLLLDLENVCKQKNEATGNQVKELELQPAIANTTFEEIRYKIY